MENIKLQKKLEWIKNWFNSDKWMFESFGNSIVFFYYILGECWDINEDNKIQEIKKLVNELEKELSSDYEIIPLDNIVHNIDWVYWEIRVLLDSDWYESMYWITINFEKDDYFIDEYIYNWISPTEVEKEFNPHILIDLWHSHNDEILINIENDLLTKFLNYLNLYYVNDRIGRISYRHWEFLYKWIPQLKNLINNKLCKK